MSQSKQETIPWTYLASGRYNKVYRSPDGKQVLKLQIIYKEPVNLILDRPERSVRIWNEINPEHPAFVVETSAKVKGWICPFIEGERASDKETSDCLIDIFNRTGRIVCDASNTKNFVRTSKGKVVCIDVGVALQFEQRDKVVFKDGAIRRKSIDSLTVWASAESNYASFFQNEVHKTPITTGMIQALLIIKKYGPDIVDVSNLNKSPKLVNMLLSLRDDKKRVCAFLQKNFPVSSLAADIPAPLSEERKQSAAKEEKEQISKCC